jgi:hypothetical protein
MQCAGGLRAAAFFLSFVGRKLLPGNAPAPNDTACSGEKREWAAVFFSTYFLCWLTFGSVTQIDWEIAFAPQD